MNIKIIDALIIEYMKKFSAEDRKNLTYDLQDNQIKISIEGDINSLRIINVLFNVIFQHILEKSAGKFFVYDLSLAIEEVLINIYKHSYKSHNGKIDLKLNFYKESVDVAIIDYGKNGNLFDIQSQLDIKHIDTFAESGRGLLILKKIVGDIRYKTENSQNILQFKKNLGG